MAKTFFNDQKYTRNIKSFFFLYKTLCYMAVKFALNVDFRIISDCNGIIAKVSHLIAKQRDSKLVD